MAANPLFSPEKKNALYCLKCSKQINRKKRNEYQDLKYPGWRKFKESAEEWKDIAIPQNDDLYTYTLVHDKISSSESAFGSVHALCRLQFRTKIQSKLVHFGKKLADHSTSDDAVHEESNDLEEESLVTQRNSRSSVGKFEKKRCLSARFEFVLSLNTFFVDANLTFTHDSVNHAFGDTFQLVA